MRLLLTLIFIGLVCDLVGQVRIVSGKVIGSEFRSKKDDAPYAFWELSEAKIFWKDSLIGIADNKGQFRLELPKTIDVIEIGWIGMYPEAIRITGNCEYLEVILLPDAIYEYLGKKNLAADKKRAYAMAHEEMIVSLGFCTLLEQRRITWQDVIAFPTLVRDLAPPLNLSRGDVSTLHAMGLGLIR